MAGPKFRIGQRVKYLPKGSGSGSQGQYIITARLPLHDDGQFRYTIQRYGGQPRLAMESELRASQLL